MYNCFLFVESFSPPLVAQNDYTLLSIIIGVLILTFIVTGIWIALRYRAKSRLFSKPTYMDSIEDRKVYNDFKNGHLYG